MSDGRVAQSHQPPGVPKVWWLEEGGVMRRRHRSFALVIGLFAAMTIASSASGSSAWLSIRQQGVSAAAQHLACDDNGDGTMSCIGELMLAFKGKIKVTRSPATHVDEVCYERIDVRLDAETGELIDGSAATGCALDTGKVSVRGIGAVTVRSTRIELTSLNCDENGCTETPSGHATVRGTWSSAGKPAVSRLRFRFDDGICTDVLMAQGRARLATFRGFVDGQRMAADLALVGAGSTLLKSRCLGGII